MKSFLKKALNSVRSKKKVIVAAAASALCLAAMVTGISASASTIPTVTFTNTANNSPDLYVTKSTQDLSGNTVETDDEFTFYVKFDGELANKEAYRVYNSAGEEVYLYSDGESTEVKSNKLTFTTDKYGGFTLKSGQTARFEWVGTGVSYEVYEDTIDGWTQIKPSGGSSATGTITANGSSVEFINVQSSEEAKLSIYKTISFPNGYTAPETPDFTFQITISGKAYDYETYTITSVSTGLSEGTGMTDSEGKFTLKGGQIATFDVEQDVDYKVEEIATDGWRITTESVYEGSTGTGGTVILSFNNASAAFAVSKKTQENSYGETLDESLEYTFQLLQSDRSVWANAQYYLYNTNGTPVYDGNGEITIGTTDENGQFTLLANQTAIFYGYMVTEKVEGVETEVFYNIDSGTSYSVYEVKSSSYTQVIPLTSSGYTDKEVNDSVEVLPFVNEPTVTSALKVTKVVDIDVETSETGQMPNTSDIFTFCLEVSEDDGATFTPVTGAVYSVSEGTSVYTYATDDDGTFTIKNNQTAVFESLTANLLYRVTETDMTVEYQLVKVEHTDAETASDETVLYDSDDEDCTVTLEEAETVTLDTNGAEVTFTNRYGNKDIDLYIVKKSGTGSLLADAEFMLYYDSALTNPYSTDAYVTDSDGIILIEDLQPGTYYLVETQAPSGYGLLAETVEISITRSTASDNGFEILINGTEYTSDTTTQVAGELNITGESGNEMVFITIFNHRVSGLPSSGSTASYATLIAGLGCVIIAFAVIMRRRKKTEQ